MRKSSRLDEAAHEVSGNEREIIVRRTFRAPRELVFDAFTNAEHISNWWGPNGFRTRTQQMDVRPGGSWRHVMHGPDGTDYPNHVVFRDVDRPAKLAWDHGTTEGEPFAFRTTVLFEEVDGGTQVTLRQVHPSREARDYVADEVGAVEGGLNLLDRFALVIEALQEAHA